MRKLDKQALHAYCIELIDHTINRLGGLLKELNEGTANDAKSSAGDKHETAISMAQLEQEKVNKQMASAQAMKQLALRFSPELQSATISSGSIIVTDKQCFYIIGAIGRVIFAETEIQCISPQSPLAKALEGRKTGADVHVMNTVYTIVDVY